MNHYVYEITNNINGKKYIGKRSTHTSIENDNYWGSGVAIKKAIAKYGKENFSKIILHICDTEKEAYSQEELEIEKVKAYNSASYYNIAKGGLGIRCGSKRAKSLPPDFKYRPPIFNVEDYIDTIKKNFESADGYALFKLKYLCGYLIMQGENKNVIIETIIALTKKYYMSHSYTNEKWLDIVNNVYLDMLNKSIEDLQKIYSTKSITIYKSEIEQIAKLKSVFIRKSALAFLIIYKFLYVNDYYVKRHDNYLKKIYNSLGQSQRKMKALNELSKNGYIELQEEYFAVPFAKFDGDDILESINIYSQNSLLLLDLYNGKKITKCQKCGDLIHKISKRKYCENCSFYDKKIVKTLICQDCGTLFVVNSLNNRSSRCIKCQHLKQLEYQRKSMAKKRNAKNAFGDEEKYTK